MYELLEDGVVQVKRFKDTFKFDDINKEIRDSYEAYVFGKPIYDYKGHMISREKPLYIKDVEYFIMMFQHKLRNYNVILEDVELIKPNDTNDIFYIRDMSYKVYINFAINGVSYKRVLLFSIPYMNNYGILNVGGKSKVILKEMLAAEYITFDKQKLILSLTLPNVMVNFGIKKKSIVLLQSKTNINMCELLRGYIIKENLKINLTKLFTNNFIKSFINEDEYKTEETIEINFDKLGIYGKLHCDAYKLDKLRNILNEQLTISSCIGEELSRNVILRDRTISKGTIVTQDIYRLMRKNQINVVYIYSRNEIKNYILGETLIFNMLDKNVTIGNEIRMLCPELQGIGITTRKIILKEPLILDEGLIISEDIQQFLWDMKVLSITCMNKSKTKFKVSLEQEIVGNNTFSAYEVFSDDELKSSSINRFSYIIGDRNSTTKTVTFADSEYLTSWDLIALTSLIGRYAKNVDDIQLLNRDEDFVKKINNVAESFSISLRKSIKTFFITTRLEKLKNIFIYNASTTESMTRQLSRIQSKWINIMTTEDKLLRPAEEENPLALETQKRRIAVIIRGHEAADAQRQIPITGFGRIDPFETPAGKNIGLVCSQAIGCKIEDGEMKTAYYRLQNISDKYYISNDMVEWVTALDELDMRIGDIMDLKVNFNELKNRYEILNSESLVLAKVPSYEDSGDNINVEKVKVKTLTHVTVSPEQSLSVASCMIPFLGYNDGARIAFGLNLRRQARKLFRPQNGLVVTSMHKSLYDSIGTYTYRAKSSGTVEKIERSYITLSYDDKNIPNDYLYMPELKLTNRSIITKSYKVAPKMKFNKGDIIIDSLDAKNGYDSIGRPTLVAYIPLDGYNYEDGVLVSDELLIELSSLTISKEVTRLSNNSKYDYSQAGREVNKYVCKGDVLGELEGYDRETCTQVYEKFRAKKHSGFVIKYDHVYRFGDNDVYEVNTSLLTWKMITKGDKVSGLHGNKGVTSILYPADEMPIFPNGKRIEIIQSPAGVVSRMNIGQILEGQAGFCAYLLGIKFNSNSINGMTVLDIMQLLEFLYELANIEEDDPDIAINKVKKIIDEKRKSSIYGQDDPRYIPFSKDEEFMYNIARDRFEFIQEWKGCFNEKGEALLYNPKFNKYYENYIAFGIPTYLKLEQEVDEKIHVRDGMCNFSNKYTRISGQPVKGASNGGGQRIGEMEFAALAAHGVTSLISENIGCRSDNYGEMLNLHLKAIGERSNKVNSFTDPITGMSQTQKILEPNLEEPIYEESDCIARSSQVLSYYIETLGLHTHISGKTDISEINNSNKRYLIGNVIKNRRNSNDEKKELYKDFNID